MTTILNRSEVTAVRDNHRPIREQLTRELLEELRRHSLDGDLTEAADSFRLTDALLRDAVRERASDVHFDPESGGYRLRFRIDGTVLDAALLTQRQGHRLLRHFKTVAGLDPVIGAHPVEARRGYELDGVDLDLRLACAPCIAGEKMAIRMLDRTQLQQRLQELGMAEEELRRVEHWLQSLTGMFIVTGPTGSGKTTTLYALLHELKLRQRCIVTIEDPVEYQIDGVSQMQVNAGQGFNFAEGLKSMLRMDPDYLMVGEIRDPQSAKAALQAALSGRAMMTTLHARDAVGAMTVLREWGMEDFEIAATLSVVIAQRLVRRLCSHCRRQQPVESLDAGWLEANGVKVPETAWYAPGCDHCRDTGYHGRTGIFEVWHLTEDEYTRILEGKDEHALRDHLVKKGHPTLLSDGLEKATAGLTSFAELRSVSTVDGVS